MLFEVFFFFLAIFLLLLFLSLFFFCYFSCAASVCLQFTLLSAVNRCSLSFKALFQCHQVSEFLLLLSG